MTKENLRILRNSALYAAAGAVGCSIGSGAPVLICFVLFFAMFVVAHLLGFPWTRKRAAAMRAPAADGSAHGEEAGAQAMADAWVRSINPNQRKPLQVGIAVAVLMGIFPPWTDSFLLDSGTQGRVQSQGSAGYAFILAPPKAEFLHSITIDITRLLVQWVVVALAVGFGTLCLGEPIQKGSRIGLAAEHGPREESTRHDRSGALLVPPDGAKGTQAISSRPQSSTLSPQELDKIIETQRAFLTRTGPKV